MHPKNVQPQGTIGMISTNVVHCHALMSSHGWISLRFTALNSILLSEASLPRYGDESLKTIVRRSLGWTTLKLLFHRYSFRFTKCHVGIWDSFRGLVFHASKRLAWFLIQFWVVEWRTTEYLLGTNDSIGISSLGTIGGNPTPLQLGFPNTAVVFYRKKNEASNESIWLGSSAAVYFSNSLFGRSAFFTSQSCGVGYVFRGYCQTLEAT